jgi:hypothetical protein
MVVLRESLGVNCVLADQSQARFRAPRREGISTHDYNAFLLIIRGYPASLPGMASYSIDWRQKILHAYER